ncbi:PBP1A family penicillin-binding protein [Lusitaniella coriacea LEGE 07157]|uniref:PBP1A family penicillin-binding protein n=1 Tax=Lusitaniella coriacea LEGE 07157 TaxID=945747 RepID=A0A8J7DNJ6_9CYAN|nr:PBP1A family penicillin-binding protein [Lusitaniella coriacea]MBE9114714.1 PBP1A family penicillin-binding protein [Lusitaniella coriacea LEGE 07157]
MTNKPPQTQISQVLTQAVQTIQAKLNSALALKPGARVPELWIQEADKSKAETYPLLGDYYRLGRSSRANDIVVRNPVVSQTHLSLKRDSKKQKHFTIQDENSTNGIYMGRRKLKAPLTLRHGDVLTLGPPELAAGVRVKYHNPPPKIIRGIQYGLYGVGGITGLIVLGIGLEWTKFSVNPLPVGVQGPVAIYSRDGQTPLRPLRNEAHRELKKLSDFSPHLPRAVMASEDSRYYWHFGVDPLGILRAVLINLRRGGIRQGGSTVTQQLARSLYPDFVGRANTAGRKLREAVVALKMETFYSKDELLKTYLNRVYLGVGSYGFEDAAQFYFDKSAADLTLSEAATLVAILPAPNSYNPVQNYKTAVQLRDRVIARMAQQGFVTTEEANRARRSRIEVSPKAKEALSNTIAPYFYSYIFTELEQLLGKSLAQEGNFIVETGLDIPKQRQAELALRNTVSQTGSQLNFDQGAIVTLNTSTGEILAMSGGADYAKSQFNRAVQAQRQPGSTFKVFAYAAALDEGISPGKSYSCAPITWRGQRYRGCERSSGSINMYRGLAQSENAVAMRVAQDAGLDNTIRIAQRLGIRSKLKATPGVVIGESEVNVLEITGAYAAFANNGVWNRPHAIKRILDSSDCEDYKNPQTCRVIYDFEQDAEANRQAIDGAIAQTMTTLLRGVVGGGTGSRASIGFGEAGKTGTTDRNVDLWFIGYVPNQRLVTGVWLGNDDNTPTRGGSTQAAQLWRDYTSKIVR